MGGFVVIIADLMLNIQVIQTKRKELGLSGAELAAICGVSREAVSNWLKGESEPRPSKTVQLAKALGLDLKDVLELPPLPSEPVVAYRTRRNREVSGPAADAAQELALNFRHLQSYLPARAKLGIAKDLEPKATDGHVRMVAADMRSRLGLSEMDIVDETHLLSLFRHFGTILVPVFWGLDKQNHENALSVYLPESETSIVIFNIGCKVDDYLYWLAHEFGHCLSLHALQGKDGETYAEQFAQQFLFPVEAAAVCSTEIGKLTGLAAFKVVEAWAKKYGISPVTVLRGVDRHRATREQGASKLEDQNFWTRYGARQKSVGSMVDSLLGTESPTAELIIKIAGERYGSPAYDALATLQKRDGGRLPTVIQSTLMVSFADAMALSFALWRS